MHIPDSILDARVIAATVAVGALGLALAVRRLDRRFGERSTVLMGTTAAFVFAAQMVNFPVGPGVSGHLLGGVLAAVLLGPWAGAVVIAAVLLVQCLMFADGGMTALGANFVNMGLIGSVGGYAIYAPIRRAIGGSTGILIAAMAAAWFSVLLASAACAVELAASGHQDQFLTILAWMALLHAVIGLGEALITGAVVRFLLVRRPDLFDEPDADADPGAAVSRYAGVKRWGEAIIGGLGVALAIAVFLAPFAYDQPDGLEFVGQKLDFLPKEAAEARIAAPIPDYQLPIAGAGTREDGDGRGRAGGHARGLCRRMGDGASSAWGQTDRGTRRCSLTRLDGREDQLQFVARARRPAEAGRGTGVRCDRRGRADRVVELVRDRRICTGAVDRPFGNSTARSGPALFHIHGAGGIPCAFGRTDASGAGGTGLAWSSSAS